MTEKYHLTFSTKRFFFFLRSSSYSVPNFPVVFFLFSRADQSGSTKEKKSGRITTTGTKVLQISHKLTASGSSHVFASSVFLTSMSSM